MNFRSPKNQDASITTMRDIQMKIDVAVLAAYEWKDTPAIASSGRMCRSYVYFNL